jgi:hypothetical protein
MKPINKEKSRKGSPGLGDRTKENISPQQQTKRRGRNRQEGAEQKFPEKHDCQFG